MHEGERSMSEDSAVLNVEGQSSPCEASGRRLVGCTSPSFSQKETIRLELLESHVSLHCNPLAKSERQKGVIPL